MCYRRTQTGPLFEPVHLPDLSIVVIDSGQAGNTAEMVARVAQRRPAVDEALSHMGELLHATLPALLAGDLSAIGKAWTKNHRLLQDVGVSNRRLDEIVSLAVTAGATGAKLAVDWPSFLARADPTWYPSSSGPPVKWYHSAFM